jgi:3-hydroxyacyl-CoA dehydrogenase
MNECLKHYCIHVIGCCTMGHRVAQNHAFHFNIDIRPQYGKHKEVHYSVNREVLALHVTSDCDSVNNQLLQSDGVEACLPHLQQQFHS